MSALPLKADVCGANPYVCFGPKADMFAKGLVLDDDLLAPDLSQSLSKRPRENIGHAARRRRHDQRNRLVGIVLTMGASEANHSTKQPPPARIAISSLHPPCVAPKEARRARKLRGPKLTTHFDTLNTRSGLFSVLTFLRIIEMVRPVVHQPGGVAQCCRLPVWGEFSHDVDRRTGKMVC
jgi:hypothetical protein